jgi:hypothetical protein
MLQIIIIILMGYLMFGHVKMAELSFARKYFRCHGDITSEAVEMLEESDRDQINRLWDHGNHEDIMFNERLNFFLVFEGILIAVVGQLYSKTPPDIFIVKATIVLGLLTTLIWWYVQIQQKIILEDVLERGRDLIPEYRVTLDRRERKRLPIRVIPLLAYCIPGLVLAFWITLLICLR